MINCKWTYNDKPFDETLADNYFGFVYLLTEKETGRKYIGAKQFRFKKSRPPKKGLKRRRVSFVSSDWIEYNSSCKMVQEAVKKNGINSFEWKILELCPTKWHLRFNEAKHIIVSDALTSAEWYNDFLMIRLPGLKNIA